MKDQWQFQMHTRALRKVGEARLHFVTNGLSRKVLKQLSANAHSTPKARVEQKIQEILNGVLAKGERLAVFPEGPYCIPIPTLVLGP